MIGTMIVIGAAMGFSAWMLLGLLVLLLILAMPMLAVQNESGFKTFTAGAALEAWRRVKLDGTTANQVVYAGAGEAAIGVTQTVAASGKEVSVRLMSAPGTFKVTAAGAIAQNAVVYGAANGKVDDAVAGDPIGILTDVTATADADLVEMLPRQQESDGGDVSVGASTAAAGTTTADAGVLPAGTARCYPVTAADDTKGVRVSATDKVTGRRLFIGNKVSNKILKVYAPSGGTINGAAADAAYSSASGKGVSIICEDATANAWLATG